MVVPPVAMVWPCQLSVDAYAGLGRQVEAPRPDCPSCSAPMGWWSGYWRHLREGGSCRRLFIPRVRCRPCGASHAFLPAFLLLGRLDAVETVGAVIVEVAAGAGVRPAARCVDVPYTTARGWWRRFRQRARRLAVALAAVAVELGGVTVRPEARLEGWALAAMTAAWQAAAGLPGWAGLGPWRFLGSVSGGRLISTNTNPLSIVIGKRRFMPPSP